ncbi:sodium:solute symporter family protein [Acetobacter oeni]|uniref:Sodium:solute symporter n=1 Tax=Acetobacter oeni TaxID=304077 RepID=A0A511XGL6_9PROT|nr:sodium:solute symporter [Acetobacter oeni]MBB3881736.1 SSS family solute:Na+ symporter [Acetobacter oeni]NHO17462.1 sodium:solute symporter [Acetobacter oeni]GBR01882.1 Na+/solute symporter [Acetobacter oeni LMG 21952]GEN62093.1 sodium:solute symporter [Acetobacter oeni]
MNGVPAADTLALVVFIAFFGITIILGSTVSHWRGLLSGGKKKSPAPGSSGGHGQDAHGNEDWGLGGRQFGPWITWFLVGGDFYTAYTVIAVPALVYAVGAYGFFALPYTIIVYPFIFVVMPRLWKIARDGGHATAADIIRARFGSRTLELAVAISGLVAVMPYIALQLIGIRTVVQALGLPGDIPLVIAFVSLAAYTWLGGLHAPAFTAFIKDVMIYIAVIAAVTLVPLKLGGYGHMFSLMNTILPPPDDTHVLKPGQLVPYATLALSSALAAFLYPHTLTGILAAKSENTVRQNAVYLPIYTIVLGLIAMLGMMAHVAGIDTQISSLVVPLLFLKLFPDWFAGFAFAAIAIGALVPAAVMAIGAANLLTHNVLPKRCDTVTGSRVAAFVVKLGALLCVLFLNAQFAIDLQLLGSVIILQTFPALVLGLFRISYSVIGMTAGWAAGMVTGLGICWMDGLRPVHTLTFSGYSELVSTGLIALAVNITVVAVFTALRHFAPGAAIANQSAK